MKEEPDLCGKVGFTELRRRRHGAPLPPAALASRFAFMTKNTRQKKFFQKCERISKPETCVFGFRKIFLQKQDSE